MKISASVLVICCCYFAQLAK